MSATSPTHKKSPVLAFSASPLAFSASAIQINPPPIQANHPPTTRTTNVMPLASSLAATERQVIPAYMREGGREGGREKEEKAPMRDQK